MVMARSLDPSRPGAAGRTRPIGQALVALLVLAFCLQFSTAGAQGIDHASFDTLLRANVRNGEVNYPGFQDNAAFRDYVKALAKPVKLETRADALVYYINAYNALAIAGILEGLSPSSFLGRAKFFKFKDWALNGQSINLYDLEHKIIRPLGEPRIHFAIICASKSCPFLRSEAYAPARLDSQLDEQARQFVNDSFRNRFDKARRTANLSEIFKWFDEDFSGPAGSVQKYIARYVADAEVAKALAADAWKVDWIDYDWSLNGTPPRGQ